MRFTLARRAVTSVMAGPPVLASKPLAEQAITGRMATSHVNAVISSAHLPRHLLRARAQESNSTPTPSDSPSSNNPHTISMTVIIVVGSCILCATILAGLTWICRCSGRCGSSSRRRRRLKQQVWSPSGAQSHFSPTPEEIHSRTGLLPSPLPQMLDSPEHQATSELHTPQRGWTLFDPPVPEIHRPRCGTPLDNHRQASKARGSDVAMSAMDVDVERSLWPPPARKPTFIERVIAGRPDVSREGYGNCWDECRQSGTSHDWATSDSSVHQSTPPILHSARLSMLAPSHESQELGRRLLNALPTSLSTVLTREPAGLPCTRRIGGDEQRFGLAETTDGEHSPALLIPDTPHTPGLAGFGCRSAWQSALIEAAIAEEVPAIAVPRRVARAPSTSLGRLHRMKVGSGSTAASASVAQVADEPSQYPSVTALQERISRWWAGNDGVSVTQRPDNLTAPRTALRTASLRVRNLAIEPSTLQRSDTISSATSAVTTISFVSSSDDKGNDLYNPYLLAMDESPFEICDRFGVLEGMAMPDREFDDLADSDCRSADEETGGNDVISFRRADSRGCIMHGSPEKYDDASDIASAWSPHLDVRYSISPLRPRRSSTRSSASTDSSLFDACERYGRSFDRRNDQSPSYRPHRQKHVRKMSRAVQRGPKQQHLDHRQASRSAASSFKMVQAHVRCPSDSESSRTSLSASSALSRRSRSSTCEKYRHSVVAGLHRSA